MVDAFARYRIVDPLKFYQTVGPIGASSQLAILLNSALRRVLGGATLADVVRNKREELMAQMRDQLDHDAQPFGIHVVDVRIRRADLPEQNSQAVYQRMQTERQREAAEFRAQGSQKSQEITRQGRPRRDRARWPRPTRKSEQIRGQGDAERNRIFAEAYGQDPDFFAFYRSMQAYERSMQHGDTHLVLRPDSDFFRYFGDPSGKATPDGGGRAGTAAATPGAGDADAAPRSRCSRNRTSPRSASGRVDVRFPRRARSGLRDRGHFSRRVSGQRQARHGRRLDMPDGPLRIAGIVSAVVGVLIVWLVRG